MIDFAAARRMMVDGQVRTSDVTDLRVLAAMLELPRERFVPKQKRALAYLDMDVAVTDEADGSPPRHLLKPMVLAKLVQAASITESDHVLDVGCASGYSSALLAHLGGSVTALENDAGLAQQARDTLAELGLASISVVSGPLVDAWAGNAPYDVILVNGAIEILPPAYLRQLKPGGRLLCIFGRAPAGKAMLYRAEKGEFSGRPLFDAAAPLLAEFIKPAIFVF